MNTQQRNYLIKKIEESVKCREKALRDSLPKEPSLSNYLLHAVMSGTFEIKTNDEIKEMIKQKALNAEAGRDSWMASGSAFSDRRELAFKAKDFFVITEEYKIVLAKYTQERDRIQQEINTLCAQSEGLITRITLASDKTLQKMINEVDDMGDISLMDTKLKALN